MYYLPDIEPPSEPTERRIGPECPICGTHFADEEEAIVLDGKWYHIGCLSDRYGKTFYTEDWEE